MNGSLLYLYRIFVKPLWLGAFVAKH